MSKSNFTDGPTTRLVGIAALEHASRTGAPIHRRWSLLSFGGELDLEDAYRVARDSSPDELYADVTDEELVELVEAVQVVALAGDDVDGEEG